MKSYDKTQIFNDIYNKTYNNTFKYILLHCNNIDNVKDILQDTYFNLYKYLSKRKINKIENFDKYIIGISKNVLKKYSKSKYNNCNVEYLYQNEDMDIIPDSEIDLELQFITKENVKSVYEYIKSKNIKVIKVFYCYYYLDMKISEIAMEMKLNESTVKNYIYRTIKELQQIFKKEDYKNV